MMSKNLRIICGPPGSGKSTLAKQYESEGYIRISQDDMGKPGHLKEFKAAVERGDNIVVDRLNSNIGYIAQNCVPCCKICNFMKRDLSEQVFLDKIKEIYENSMCKAVDR